MGKQRTAKSRRAGFSFDVRCFFALALLIVAPRAFAQETRRQYLSGGDGARDVQWRFQCASGAQSGYWTNIPVPSNWELEGFGSLNYRRDPPEAYDERGLYEHDFTVPADWSGRRVFLVFEGAMTDTSAKVNGESAGPVHQGGFYRFKYEVTKLLKFGATNRLEVTVAKHSADGSVNRAERTADYWVFGGIYRPVYLEAVPKLFIERVAIDARADGSFTMDVLVNGAKEGDSIEAQVMSLDGKPVGESFGVPASAGPDRLKAELRTGIPSPHTWTAETPNLYSVEVRLKRGREVVHRIQQRFGFRTMEVRDGDGLYLNGRRVILKGANRHSFAPESGRCLSPEIMMKDILTLKQMNMNAVRCSHYPPDAHFLDLCDELGLYVLDELGGWHNRYDTEVGRKLVEEMVARDVNHPCVLFWDNGNEGGWNTNLDAVFAEFDPQQRRVLHPWSPFSGVNTAHYLGYDNARVASEGAAMFYRNGSESVNTNDATKYIYLPTEFQHGLYDGGAGAGLEDYWNMMSAGKTLGGGFIWALLDEGVLRPDTGKIDVAGNQAPDGVVGPHREPEGSFYTIKDVWSPIQITREADGTFSVENHYSFTDARDCRFTRELWRFPKPYERGSGSGHIVVKQETVVAPSIPPGATGTLKLEMPEAREPVDALALVVSAPGTSGDLWTWVWPMPKAGDLARLINEPAPQRAAATETSDAIEIRSGDLAVTISKQSGMLTGIARGSQKFSLANGPRLADGPPPAAGSNTLTGLRSEQDGPDWIVSAKYAGDLKSVLWRVFGNGWVQCEYKYSATGPKDFFGVAFDYPEELVKHKRWLGDGPYRVWKNRLRGARFDVWENDYNNTITGWRDWIYPEFKGCFADVRWLQLQTTEGQITVVPEHVPFVQVLTPEQPPDNLAGKTRVNLPSAGLALLHAIPAVGSKFKDPAECGPQSQPAVAAGEYSGKVNFYFGPFPKGP